MNKLKLTFILILFMAACNNEKIYHRDPKLGAFDEYPTYEGELGVFYTKEKTIFKVWAPSAQEVKLSLYESGHEGQAYEVVNMYYTDQGVWEMEMQKDLNGKFYTFQTKVKEVWQNEVPGEYAKAVGVNGKRGAIIDMSQTNPEGWENDKKPELKNFTDIILYELHVRDISSRDNSGIKNVGKFLGLVEEGTKSPKGESTGIDHFKELGITHVHLLPVFDYRSIDELTCEGFNWGYDPQNYNVPEGSYSTNPQDPISRIKEFKQMVQGFHKNGIRVIMDVVYNHVGSTEENSFDQLVPGYYFRQNADGTFSNASGCGNETASERAMMRRFMVNSLKYWATEYKIDGFRFDLMGIHDIETMNQISTELHKIDSTIFIYGEGWTAGGSPLPAALQATKHNAPQLKNIAVFSDDMRDGIKGHWSGETEKGFVAGKDSLRESIKFGVVASTQHPEVNYDLVNYSKAFWANKPSQTINYVSCHDNHTLWDKLKVSNPQAEYKELKKMHMLANGIILTSQGVPFLHAGVEMQRTKLGEHNTYNMPDSVNQINWEWKTENKELYEYYKSLVALRKHHPAFRMTSTDMIKKHLLFIEQGIPNVISFNIAGNANGDNWAAILVIYNSNNMSMKLEIPQGDWTLVADGSHINEKGIKQIVGNKINVPEISMTILVSTSSIKK